jgi:hypothetical protein
MKCMTHRTCEAAWFAAARFLQGATAHREAHNLVVEIQEPAAHTEVDLRMREQLDAFLRVHDANPVFTVAETIFPAAQYKEEGVRGVFETYPNEIYPAIKLPTEWGRYAYRLVRATDAKGKYNPLERILNRLKAAVTGHDMKRACFELPFPEDPLDLPIAHPEDKRTRGGPCLSLISLKLGRDGKLYLTAAYRHHYFIERALGNYLGLAALQAFLCDQSGLDMGPLVCVSTLAKLDDGGRWSRKKVDVMLDTCGAFVSRDQSA